ncbi:unnamed protein product [Moneuplotes crassus]|uniref:RING-type domain-containing protein n=1 Tax=Euplotes crassus TaxID=5936 RepID=A0AAD1Y9A5_EUPCR|nr:unnamed protein product [Moneuplotes crassus]
MVNKFVLVLLLASLAYCQDDTQLEELVKPEIGCDKELLDLYFEDEKKLGEVQDAQLIEISEDETLGVDFRFIRYWKYKDSEDGKIKDFHKENGKLVTGWQGAKKIKDKGKESGQEENEENIELDGSYLYGYKISPNCTTSGCFDLASNVYIVFYGIPNATTSNEDASSVSYYGIIKLPKSKIHQSFPFKYWFQNNDVENVEFDFCSDKKLQRVMSEVSYSLSEGLEQTFNINPYQSNSTHDSKEEKSKLHECSKDDCKPQKEKDKIFSMIFKLEAAKPTPNKLISIPLCMVVLIVFWIMGINQNYECRNFNIINTSMKERLHKLITFTFVQVTIVLVMYTIAASYQYLGEVIYVPNFLIGNWGFYISANIGYTFCNDRGVLKQIIRNFCCILLTCVFVLLIVIIVIFPLAASYIFFSLKEASLLTNLWWFLVLFNFLIRKRYAINVGHSILISITISFSGVPFARSSEYFPTYSYSYAFALLFVHLCGILVIQTQAKYGTRFFLPTFLRRNLYDKYMKKLTHFNDQECGQFCQICTNPLDYPELEYHDVSETYKFLNFGEGVYIETPCSHTYHPNCLFKMIQETNPQCPVCSHEVPVYDFDD